MSGRQPDDRTPPPKFLLGINREKLGGGMDPEEYERKRKQAQRAGIARSLLMLAGLVVVTVLFARRTASPGIEQVTTAAALDANQEPAGIADIFGPEDTVYVSVEALGYEEGSDVSARLIHADRTLATLPVDADRISERYLGWAFSPADAGREAWEPGSYTVEIVFRGQRVLGTADFQIAGDEER